jgi:hypothetical protein
MAAEGSVPLGTSRMSASFVHTPLPSVGKDPKLDLYCSTLVLLLFTG